MKTICIRLADDGSFQVGELPADYGTAAPAMGSTGAPVEQPDAGMTPAGSLDEALSLAGQMLTAGQDAGGGTIDQLLDPKQAESQMAQGFQKARGLAL
ncbi:MAG TPA: hypothetical protein VIT92_00620 [Burkholderiaceae bacterium]